MKPMSHTIIRPGIYNQIDHKGLWSTTIILLNECNIKPIPNEIIILINQCIIQPSPENLLFAINGDCHRDPQLAKEKKTEDYGIISHKYNKYISTTPSQSSGIIAKKAQEDCKSQKQWMTS